MERRRIRWCSTRCRASPGLTWAASVSILVYSSMFRDDDGDVAEQFIDGEAGETKVGEYAGDEDEARAGKVSYRGEGGGRTSTRWRRSP